MSAEELAEAEWIERNAAIREEIARLKREQEEHYKSCKHWFTYWQLEDDQERWTWRTRCRCCGGIVYEE